MTITDAFAISGDQRLCGYVTARRRVLSGVRVRTVARAQLLVVGAEADGANRADAGDTDTITGAVLAWILAGSLIAAAAALLLRARQSHADPVPADRDDAQPAGPSLSATRRCRPSAFPSTRSTARPAISASTPSREACARPGSWATSRSATCCGKLNATDPSPRDLNWPRRSMISGRSSLSLRLLDRMRQAANANPPQSGGAQWPTEKSVSPHCTTASFPLHNP